MGIAHISCYPWRPEAVPGGDFRAHGGNSLFQTDTMWTQQVTSIRLENQQIQFPLSDRRDVDATTDPSTGSVTTALTQGDVKLRGEAALFVFNSHPPPIATPCQHKSEALTLTCSEDVTPLLV